MISTALRSTSMSYFAPGSVLKVFQYATAFSHSSPSLGLSGLPLRYSKVISSGAIIPALAPASIDMLQIDILASILSSRMVDPANSMTAPVPPAVPITPMMCRTISFELTPSGSFPSTDIRMFFDFAWGRVWVARTCSTSEVPIPKARAPNAPCVDV